MKEQVKLTKWNFGVVLNDAVKYVTAVISTDTIKTKCHNTNSLYITTKRTEIKETIRQDGNNGKTTSLTFRKNLQILYMLFRNQLKDDPLNRLHSKSQSAFTCSKLTIETLEQVVKYVQSYQSRHQNHVIFHIFQTLLQCLDELEKFICLDELGIFTCSSEHILHFVLVFLTTPLASFQVFYG